jgi:hypothetical protein
MRSLNPKQATFFETVAATVTPEVASLEADGRARMVDIVDTALSDRDEATRTQFGTFLTVIRLAPVARYGRPFDRLDPARRTAVLAWFEDCPISLLRKGFWGLKALVFMGYYGQPEHWPEIGYAPSFDGREGVRRA